jgi:zinc/manganese transport system ATP-binding protein
MSRGGAIAFDDLTLGYDRHPAVHHLAGRFEPGSLTAVVGPNGAGKSTLLKGIVGLLRPLSGRVALQGRAGEAADTRIAYLPQAAEIDRSFPITVFDLVSTGLWRRTGLFGSVGRADCAAVSRALAAVGLTGFERRPVGTLSGGQMQRALFARLLLQDAGIILLDEPLTAVDARTAADLVEIVRSWHAETRTVIAVLHDLDLARRVFPQALLIAREPVAWGATQDVLTPANLMRARTMLEAHDPHAAACAKAA